MHQRRNSILVLTPSHTGALVSFCPLWKNVSIVCKCVFVGRPVSSSAEKSGNWVVIFAHKVNMFCTWQRSNQLLAMILSCEFNTILYISSLSVAKSTVSISPLTPRHTCIWVCVLVFVSIQPRSSSPIQLGVRCELLCVCTHVYIQVCERRTGSCFVFELWHGTQDYLEFITRIRMQ